MASEELVMESVKSWFQDWSDACTYARECAPDLSFLPLHDPYPALASVAAVCFAIWWWNEKQIGRALNREEKARLREGAHTDGLNEMLGQMRSVDALHRKQAA
jgi:hypothetical protein